MKKTKGIITSIVSNRYHVFTKGEIKEALAMGKLRMGEKPIVGDEVILENLEGRLVIQEILKRKNSLQRPLVANVDQALIVMSAKEPEFSFQILDRLIALVAYEGIQPIIVLSKIDLIDDSRVSEIANEYKNYAFFTRSRDKTDLKFESIFKNKISVLAGQSGVGKSSLLNQINPQFSLKTQEVSKSLGRGRHTTRHNELFPMFGGWIADTPGFSSLDFSHMDGSRLSETIPDFQKYQGQCKFRDCLHITEPSCKIKENVENGNISSMRYKHYLEMIDLIKEDKR